MQCSVVYECMYVNYHYSTSVALLVTLLLMVALEDCNRRADASILSELEACGIAGVCWKVLAMEGF